MRLEALAAAIFGMAAVANAQAPDPLAPLERYIGTWTYEGEGNGARVSCRSERRWITNHSFVESHRECATANGPITQVEVYGFDSSRKIYMYWGFNSGQALSTYTAPTMGTTVVWTGEARSSTSRCSDTFAADGLSSEAQCEVINADGKTWRKVSGGHYSKVQ